MARVTAEQYAEKQARRLKASTEDIRRGIAAVTVAPGAQAAKKADKMLRSVTESVTSGEWARRTAGVSLADWQRAAADKGVNRISQGIDAVQPQQVAMATRLLAAVDAASAKVKSMPSDSLEDSIARMTTFVREMSKAKIKA